jgi:hypothetical protein
LGVNRLVSCTGWMMTGRSPWGMVAVDFVVTHFLSDDSARGE